MGELADYLCEKVGGALEQADAAAWLACEPQIREVGLEAALLQNPPTASLESAIVARSAELIGLRERQIVKEVFTGKRVLRFTRLLAHIPKPDAGIPIVTTNYDRLLEIAAEEAGLGADTMFVGHFAGALDEKESQLGFLREVKLRGRKVRYRYRDRVSIFKPHGSLDWYHREGKPVRYSGDLELPRLIITPGLNKFRNGYESPFDRHRERANSAIDRASRFLIVGYGFNDDHLETHLTPSIKSGIPTLLLTHTLSPNAKKLALEYENVVALERCVIDGAEGTSIIVKKAGIQIPDIAWWDLGTFISEVLEP